MKTASRPLPLLWFALAVILSAAAFAPARQEAPRQSAFALPPSVAPPAQPPIQEFGALPEPMSVRALEPAEAAPAPGSATADSFLEQNQQLASRRLAELTEACDRLRAQLAEAEAERAKWQAITEAMAAVPDRFHQLTGPRPPQPTGGSAPFEELVPNLPPSDPPFSASPSPSAPGFFDQPSLPSDVLPPPSPFDVPGAPTTPSDVPPDVNPFDLPASRPSASDRTPSADGPFDRPGA